MFVSEVTLKNFRCFRDVQKVRLAPLTLLMGENSAGKTSFMAMLRILMDTVHGRSPNFKEEPYDLGTFEEIIHYQNGKKKKGQAECFEAGFALNDHRQNINMDLTFGKQETNSIHPSSIRERISYKEGDIWLESDLQAKHLKFHTHNGTWESTGIDDKVLDNSKNIKGKNKNPELKEFLTEVLLRRGLFSRPGLLHGPIVSPQMIKWTSKKYSDEDLKQLKQLISIAEKLLSYRRRPYASAPVRSKPKRHYDPARVRRDPEGESIPMYLAELFSQHPKEWTKLKKQLEGFGKQSGLFDEISIKRLGKKGSNPFEIQVRKFGKTKGPRRNLIDVGYGVSQALPVITELLSENAPSLFLLQQPEVHLHPSAQAALGSLFCQVVDKKKQLLIETHSDHLMDRIRMDVRDKKTKLKPEDVSILFFERKGLSVDIHSIKIDKEGNVLNAPECYREFFRNETNRSLGL